MNRFYDKSFFLFLPCLKVCCLHLGNLEYQVLGLKHCIGKFSLEKKKSVMICNHSGQRNSLETKGAVVLGSVIFKAYVIVRYNWLCL